MKDPSFLFYVNDFLGGTMFMSNEQVGIYIKLLCIQHQHGGLIDKNIFHQIINGHKPVADKFIETEEGFFNKRMAEIMEARAKKSTNMSINAKKRWEEYKQQLCNCNAIAMQPINVNVNDNTLKTKASTPISNTISNKDKDKQKPSINIYKSNTNSIYIKKERKQKVDYLEKLKKMEDEAKGREKGKPRTYEQIVADAKKWEEENIEKELDKNK